MKRLKNIMLKTFGLYIPFLVVILGIGACSFMYKDALFGLSNKEEPAENVTSEDVLPSDAGPTEEEPAITEPETPAEPEQEEPVDEPELPGIGECVCPNTDGTLS